MKQWILYVCLVVGPQLCTSTPTLWAGPKVVVGSKVSARQLVSIDAIDHSGWDGLLQKYVNQRGEVNYSRWKQTPSDMRGLDQYLRLLSRADRRRSASQQARPHSGDDSATGRSNGQ